MNSTTKSDIDAPFLDEEEKDIVTGFETAIEDGRIPSQSLTEQESVRAEWESVLENTQKRKAVTLRLQERDIKRVKTHSPGDRYALSNLPRLCGAQDSNRRNSCQIIVACLNIAIHYLCNIPIDGI